MSKPIVPINVHLSHYRAMSGESPTAECVDQWTFEIVNPPAGMERMRIYFNGTFQQALDSVGDLSQWYWKLLAI